MDLTAQERSLFYSLAEAKNIEIEIACRGNGADTRERRRRAADVLHRAFDVEIATGRNRHKYDLVAACKERTPELLREDECGFLEVILVMIVVNVIARVIVNWLYEVWSKKSR